MPSFPWRKAIPLQLSDSPLFHLSAEGFQRLQHGAQRPPFLVAPPAEEEEAAEEDEEEGEEPEAEDIVPRRSGGDAHHSELAIDAADASPPSSSSSDKPHPPAAVADERRIGAGDGPEPCRPPRSSILLQLIACGSAVAKVRSGLLRDSATAPPPPSSGSSTPNTSGRRSLGSLHKGGGLRRRAAAAECDEEIHYMSENPRFGNPQLEDKEYFSGSIVESIAGNRSVAAATGPGLKKSSSYNEDR